MIESDLRAAYERVLREHSQDITQETAAREQRSHPRLHVQSDDLWISAVPQFAMLDMSATGMAVESNHPLRVGERVQISLGQTLSLQARVVACTMVEAPDEYTDGTFRLQCQFLEDLRGMELLVRVVTGA